MKVVYEWSMTHVGSPRQDFEISSHKGRFYLKINNRKVAVADTEEKLRVYINGFSMGYDIAYGHGSKKWFEKHMDLKQKVFKKLRKQGINITYVPKLKIENLT